MEHTGRISMADTASQEGKLAHPRRLKSLLVSMYINDNRGIQYIRMVNKVNMQKKYRKITISKTNIRTRTPMLNAVI